MRKLTQSLYPSALRFQCPCCDSEIPFFDVKIGFGQRWTRKPFGCPHCKRLLSVSAIYAWSVFLGMLLLALASGILLGIHPWFLLVPAVVIIQLLIAMLAGAYVKVFFPPKIVEYYQDDLSFRQRM
jgi:hypothetical protein